MPGIRHRGARQLGALLLLALLSCPIALSSHTHQPGDSGASRASCTFCAATAHAPALTPPALPQFVLFEQRATPVRQALTPPARGEFRTCGPRAPPPASSTLSA